MNHESEAFYLKILVIGGSKFIGRHVVRELLAAGNEVTLFNRGNHPQEDEDLSVRHLCGDRFLPGSIQSAIATEHFDAVVDMVAYDAPETSLAIQQLQGRCDRYLMISTASVYAEPTASPIHETDTLITSDDPRLAYGRKKVLAEQAVFRAHRKTGFPVTVLRLPAVFGEYDHQAREWYFIKRLLDHRNQMILPEGGCGVYHREYAGNIGVQVDFLLRTPASNGHIYNSGHLRTPNYRQLVSIAANLSGQPMTFYSLPAPLFPHIPNLASPVIFTQSTAKLEAVGYQEKYDITQALKRTMDWFTENPITEFLPTQRNQAHHFDYVWEDRLIADGTAVKLD